MERVKSGFAFITSSYKRVAAVLIIAAILLAIPITVNFLSQQQDIRQRAAGATSIGPRSPTQAVNDPSFGAYPWDVAPGSVITNVTVSDDIVIYNGGVLQGKGTNYVKTSGYGFNIPQDAIITGIQAEIEGGNCLSCGQTTNKDYGVKLVKGGTVQGIEKARGALFSVNTYTSYGGATDLWGLTLTPGDVNSSTFGVAVSAQPGPSNPAIDHIRMTVFYSIPPTPTPLPTNTPTPTFFPTPTPQSSILIGSYKYTATCTSLCTGDYIHTMNITTENLDNQRVGSFTGTGFYNADPSIKWNVTGTYDWPTRKVSFHIVYTGTDAGYTSDGFGGINDDGTMLGTATSSQGQTATWTLTPLSTATPTTPPPVTGICTTQCIAPPAGCHYEGGTQCTCGTVVCPTPTQPPTPTPILCIQSGSIWTCPEGYVCNFSIEGGSPPVCLPGIPTNTPTPTLALTTTPTSSCQLKNKGDANCDGTVNTDDFNIWRDAFVTMSPR